MSFKPICLKCHERLDDNHYGIFCSEECGRVFNIESVMKHYGSRGGIRCKLIYQMYKMRVYMIGSRTEKILRTINMVRIGTAVALIGSAYVSSGDSLMANMMWVVGDPILATYNYKKKEYEQATLFFIFFVLALRGVLIL